MGRSHIVTRDAPRQNLPAGGPENPGWKIPALLVESRPMML